MRRLTAGCAAAALALSCAQPAEAGTFVGLMGGPHARQYEVDGASIDAGSYCPAPLVYPFNGVATDWLSEALPLLNAHGSARINIAIASASTFHFDRIPYPVDLPHTTWIFGPMWANNVRTSQSSADIVSYIDSGIAFVYALGVRKILVATGYLVLSMTQPQQDKMTAVNAAIRSTYGGGSVANYPGVIFGVIEFSTFDTTTQTADGGHPTCPGSPVQGFAGNGTVTMANMAVPTLNLF